MSFLQEITEILRSASKTLSGRRAVDVEFNDSAHIDAFGRLRVSNPTNLWVNEFQYNLHPLYLEEITATNGAVTHLPNESAAQLAVTAEDGSKASLTTFDYFRYQPGKSHNCAMTFVADRLQNSTTYFVCRTKSSGSVVDNKTPQTNWIKDHFDGTGPSNVNLEITRGQLLHIDMQWLSMGRVRYGLHNSGHLHYGHEENAANVLGAAITTTANLPVRWEAVTDATKTRFRIGYFDDENGWFLEIEGDAAVASLRAICSTVYSEGGSDKELGHSFGLGNGAVYRTGIGTTRVPIASIRPAQTLNSVVNRLGFILETIDVIADDAMTWELIYKPTSITGVDWQSPVAHSATEFDISGTAITGGVIIGQGYIAANNRGGVLGVDIKNKLPFTLDGAGSDQSRSLTIAATTMGGTNKNAAGTFNIVEIR